ncbi:MAG: hypothetical protein ABI690_08405 [Chloroflexota bacterium]
MLPNNRLGALIVTSLVAAIVLLIALVGKPATAQDQPAREMHALLETLNQNGAVITLLFDKPLVSGEGVWTLPDVTANRAISEVGADYVCFTEPWNNTTRVRCTPFSNITSVSYENR